MQIDKTEKVYFINQYISSYQQNYLKIIDNTVYDTSFAGHNSSSPLTTEKKYERKKKQHSHGSLNYLIEREELKKILQV